MIDILLASYNGEKYIGQQIESILAQTCTDWRLIIQDDCSSDATWEIVSRYAAEHPDKIRVWRNVRNLGSAKNNFFDMLRRSDADYLMTCDQDDVWLADKVENTLRAMKQMEERYGRQTPLLVHTDLKVVDRELRPLAQSLFSMQGMDCRRSGFSHLLVQNIVTGCTMMANRALRDKIAGNPEQIVMHDWWFALTAAAFGHISFVAEPTILYRQHGHNQVGAKNTHSFSYLYHKFINKAQAQEMLAATIEQAEEFLQVYRPALSARQTAVLEAYSAIARHAKLSRVMILCRYRLLKKGVFRKAGQILFI